MSRIGIYGILSVVLFGLIGCAPGKSDKEESVRLYKEAIVLLGSDSVTVDDCLAAQRLLEQALDADSENIDVYFGKVLNELNLWRPDSAYRTASVAIEKIGEAGKNRMKAYFYTVKGFIAYDRGDEADAEKQLSEALSLYESYLTEDPANMDYLLNKSVLLSGLEGKQTALDFIAKSPLKEADKQALIHSLSEFEFRQFGETWRAKHDALVANGLTETNTISNTFKK